MSGMDTDSMVKSMLKGTQAKYDTIYQRRTQLAWKKAAMYDTFASLKTFRTKIFDNRLQSNMSPKKASSSNQSVVSATANAEAGNVSHTITVSQIADGVKKSSSGSITPTGNSKDTLQNQFGVNAAFSFVVGDGTTTKTINVDPTTESIYDVVGKINSSGTNIAANYDINLDRFFIYNSNSGSNACIDFSATDASGLSFLQNNLKLNVYSTEKQSSGSITTGTSGSTLETNSAD
jgi:flagellar hook-associated protein 2